MVLVGQWRAFPRGAAGGNPCPLVTGARDLTAGQMQAVAAHYGHESAFITGLAEIFEVDEGEGAGFGGEGFEEGEGDHVVAAEGDEVFEGAGLLRDCFKAFL